MADTYSKVLIHCVFSTKNRLPQIAEPEKLWSYLRAIARNCKADTLAGRGNREPCTHSAGSSARCHNLGSYARPEG